MNNNNITKLRVSSGPLSCCYQKDSIIPRILKKLNLFMKNQIKSRSAMFFNHAHFSVPFMSRVSGYFEDDSLHTLIISLSVLFSLFTPTQLLSCLNERLL